VPSPRWNDRAIASPSSASPEREVVTAGDLLSKVSRSCGPVTVGDEFPERPADTPRWPTPALPNDAPPGRHTIRLGQPRAVARSQGIPGCPRRFAGACRSRSSAWSASVDARQRWIRIKDKELARLLMAASGDSLARYSGS
jgi:hypothetical protein